VLTYDFEVRAVDRHDPYLFRAVRSRGANSGIATAFEFQASPVPGVCADITACDAADTAELLTWWGRAVEASPVS
jgi:hypothetical protein